MSQGFEVESTKAKTGAHQQQKPAAADIKTIQQSLVEHFGDIEDPRVERTKKHQLIDIIVITILAIIAGAQGWEDIENYGISKQSWLEEFLELSNGIPSDDTFRRVFEFIEPQQLNQCFLSWVNHLITKMGGEVIPIDGKTVRGSYDRSNGKGAIHLVSAWASEQRLVLGQIKVEDKSNEITAIPALLELLDISGAIITIDALGTQTEIAKQIIAKQADYVLALKANHPTLHSQVKEWFETAMTNNFSQLDVSYDKRLEKGHHRTEIREVWTVPISAIPELYQPKIWAGLQSLVMIVRVRHLWNQTTREVQFYLTSLQSHAQRIGLAIRKHWGIENQSHWTLDCTFSEDACRIRSFHSPENFALLRRLALNALQQEQTYKRSLRQKMKRAGMDDNYMIQILTTCFIASNLNSSEPLCQ